MATRKNSTTSKTAHVLNILSAGETETVGTGLETQSQYMPPREDAAPHYAAPPYLSDVKSGDDMLAEQIRAAMEDELLALTEAFQSDVPPAASVPPSAAPTPPPEESPPPPPQTAPVSAEPPLPPPIALAPPVEAPPPQEAAQAERYESSTYVNIMQQIVEEKAPRYIHMFDLCGCSRCVADVKALALTSLPAKYVVMSKQEESLLLTIYEGRYNTAISAQLIQACKEVMDHPRHILAPPPGGR